MRGEIAVGVSFLTTMADFDFDTCSVAGLDSHFQVVWFGVRVDAR